MSFNRSTMRKWDRPKPVSADLAVYHHLLYMKSSLSSTEAVQTAWDSYNDRGWSLSDEFDTTSFVLACSLGVVDGKAIYSFRDDQIERLTDLGATVGEMSFVLARNYDLRGSIDDTGSFAEYYLAAESAPDGERLGWSLLLRHIGVQPQEAVGYIKFLGNFGFDTVAAIASENLPLTATLLVVENGIDPEMLRNILST